jgi:hypothetical protein
MFHHPDHLSLQMLVGRGELAPVTLSSILASPHWQAKIAQIPRNGNSKLWANQFLSESVLFDWRQLQQDGNSLGYG